MPERCSQENSEYGETEVIGDEVSYFATADTGPAMDDHYFSR